MRIAAILAALVLCGIARGDVVADSYDARSREARAIIRRNVPSAFVDVQQDVPLHVIDPLAMSIMIVQKPGRVIGLYMNYPIIWVDATLSPVMFTHTAIHEYGHFVYYQLMTIGERKEWKQIWQILGDADMLPSDYAFANEAEGFAECFADVYEMRGGARGNAIERGRMRAIEKRLSPLARKKPARKKPAREWGAVGWLPLMEFRALPALNSQHN